VLNDLDEVELLKRSLASDGSSEGLSLGVLTAKKLLNLSVSLDSLGRVDGCESDGSGLSVSVHESGS